ncbi:hypothetical protein [Azospirillum sp. sgz301742]
MNLRPETPFQDAYSNATSVFTGRDFIHSLGNNLGEVGGSGLQHQKNTLAGWIALIADDRGLGPQDVAGVAGLDRELAAAILGGTVKAVPLSVLDRTLRALENRTH